MTEGDEAGDVGVARVFCGLAKFNQHLDHVFVEATEGFDNQGKKHATVFLHLRVILGDLAVGAVESSILTRDRSGLGASIRRGSRMRNGPVSGEYLCHLRECVVDIKSFSVGQDALVDGREAELVGVLLPPAGSGSRSGGPARSGDPGRRRGRSGPAVTGGTACAGFA